MTRVPKPIVLVLGLASAACASTSAETTAIATMQEAVTAYRAGHLAKAEELGLRARAERPGFVDPLFLVASIRERGERWGEAREAYREVLAVDPTSTAAAVALAQTFVAERNLPEAQEWLLRTIEEDPGAEAAAFNLGSLHEDLGDAESACGWFGLSAALDTRDPRAPTRIAQIRLAQGRRDEARAAAEDAVRRAPDYAPARAALAASRPR